MDVTTSTSGRIAGVSRPCQGERVSGDAVFLVEENHFIWMGLSDGAGHGRPAAAISSKVQAFIHHHHHPDLVLLMSQLHQQLQPCLGAAVALMYMDLNTRRLSYAGVGNIACHIIGNRDKSFVSNDGMVGARMRTPLFQSESLIPGDRVVMTSDGITSRFHQELDRELLHGPPPGRRPIHRFLFRQTL